MKEKYEATSDIFRECAEEENVVWKTKCSIATKYPPEPTEVPSWEALMLIEPRLAFLAYEVCSSIIPDRNLLSWYTQVKRQFLRLVGFGAEKEELRTGVAYDVVYDYLSKLYDQRLELEEARNAIQS